MGVPPWKLLKLPLSLCNASRRVSTNVLEFLQQAEQSPPQSSSHFPHRRIHHLFADRLPRTPSARSSRRGGCRTPARCSAATLPPLEVIRFVLPPELVLLPLRAVVELLLQDLVRALAIDRPRVLRRDRRRRDHPLILRIVDRRRSEEHTSELQSQS